jgi:hypothetical protein
VEVCWEAITAIGTSALAVTGVAAIIYTHFQLRQSREHARIQHLRDLVREFDLAPMSDRRRELAVLRLGAKDRILPLDEDNPLPCLYEILDFFEHIGLLVKRGHLDGVDVWDSFSYWMFNIFADARSLIEQERKDDPTVYSDLVELIEQIRTIEKAKGGKNDSPSKEDIEGFYVYEKDRQLGAPLPTQRRRRKH